MNILLDTHILLCCLYDPSKLTDTACNIIEDPDNWICFSLISLWECELKHRKHPELFEFSGHDVYEDCIRSGFKQIDLYPRHIFNLRSFETPDGLNHKDPFDKMLMSQAKTDYMLFLTHDARIREYGIPCIKYV